MSIPLKKEAAEERQAKVKEKYAQIEREAAERMRREDDGYYDDPD
jgi:hypothetical protein